MEHLPEDILFHIFSFLSPSSFTSFSQLNHYFRQYIREKREHTGERDTPQERYYKEWFLGEGCAGYLYPQVHQILNSGMLFLSFFSFILFHCLKNYKGDITAKEYYKIIRNFTKEYRIVSIPGDQKEPLVNLFAIM